MMALAGLEKADKINKEILSVDGAERMSTFYGYYMLEARAKAGDYQGALDVIREYWGGMVDQDATPFGKTLKSKGGSSRIDELVKPGWNDLYGDFGDYCYAGYRHSLCHGWSSGPAPWLSQYVLGIHVIAPGSKEMAINPCLVDLDWAEGIFLTPYGIVKVRHEKRADGTINTRVDASEEITVINQNKWI